MTVGTARSADRVVALGMLAIRPVVYRGASGGTRLAAPVEPIAGLRIRSTSSRKLPIFHASTNCYGFVDLPAGRHRIHLEDPESRFLMRAIEVVVPDRSALREALERGARVPPVDGGGSAPLVPPVVPAPPFVTVPLRPAPGSIFGDLDTSLWGVLRDAAGNGVPLAWIRVSTPQGDFVTCSDARGEYLATLPFLRPIVTTLDIDPEQPVIQTVLAVAIEAYPLLNPPARGADPLAIFPASFDDLDPLIRGFEAIYHVGARITRTTNVTVGARVRLDLQPV